MDTFLPEKEEEEYLFLSYKDKETGKIKSDWVEVGEKESESDVEYDPATICGIMKTYKEKGELLEVSLYHNHPQPTAVLFSDADLFGYALMTENLKIAFPKQTFTFDFRVITIDGMLTLSPVGADALEKFINSTVQVPFKSSPKSSSPMPAMFVLLQKRGKEFADMLSEHGIQCTFQPRQLDKNPVK